MTGEVEVLIGFEPQRIYLRKVPKGTQHTETVKLVGKRAAEVKLSEITSSLPEIQAKLTTDNGQPALEVSLKAPDKEGRINGTITVKTNLDSPKELKLPVSAQVTGDLVVDRSYVLFSPFDAKKKPTARLAVSSLSEKPFKIKGVSDPAGTVSGIASQKGPQWTVELTLNKDTDKPRGKLVLKTDRKDQAELEVNYGVRRLRPHSQNAMNNRPGAVGGQKFSPIRLSPGAKRPGGAGPLRLAPGSRPALPMKKAPGTPPAPPAPTP